MRENTRKIDFTFLATKLWLGKYIILLCIALGVAASLFYISWSPFEYSSKMSMMPEDGSGGNANSQLAIMMGVYTGGSSSDAYSPIIYPDIVSSLPFITGLFDVEVQMTNNDTTFTLRQYIEEKTVYPWWKKNPVLDLPDTEPRKAPGEIVDPFHLTAEESLLVKMLRSRIWAALDKKTGEVQIGVTMQDPLVAAQLTDTVAARLQEYIVDYRTSKARRDLDYAIGINEDAKRQYYEAQSNYAEYMDANQGLALYSAQTTRDRLENEMQLAFNLYNQTSQRVQTAEAKVQEVTPVYAVVDPATVPLYPSAPAKMRIMVVFIGGAALLGIIIVLWPTLFGNRFMAILRREKRQRRQRRLRRRERNSDRSLLDRLLFRHRSGPEEEVDEVLSEDEDRAEDEDPVRDYNPEDSQRFAPRDTNDLFILEEEEYVLPEDADSNANLSEENDNDHSADDSLRN